MASAGRRETSKSLSQSASCEQPSNPGRLIHELPAHSGPLPPSLPALFTKLRQMKSTLAAIAMSMSRQSCNRCRPNA